MSFFSKFFTKDKKETLDQGLEKTRSSVFEKITRAVAGKSSVDDEVLDDIEEALITSDVGLDTTVKIIEALEERVARDKVASCGLRVRHVVVELTGNMRHRHLDGMVHHVARNHRVSAIGGNHHANMSGRMSRGRLKRNLGANSVRGLDQFMKARLDDRTDRVLVHCSGLDDIRSHFGFYIASNNLRRFH